MESLTEIDVPDTADLLFAQREGVPAPSFPTAATILADTGLHVLEDDLPVAPKASPLTYVLLGPGFEQALTNVVPGPAFPQISNVVGIPAHELVC